MRPHPDARRPAAGGDRAGDTGPARVSRGPVLPPAGANARPGEVNGNAKVTAAAVCAWRREAARVVRERLRVTKGLNAKTGAPLASVTGAPLASVLRGTGLFARLARAHTPPVSVAAVCMAVYGDTCADLPARCRVA